jgi:acyl-CoA reductase-like NAD-dependent aldehyde dehydrogenase
VWRRGRGAELTPTDPATGRALCTLHAASVEDVDGAVRSGAAAAQDPSWRRLLPHERARYLGRIADLIERDIEVLAALQTANTGKTLAETRALVRSAAGTFRFVGAALETMEESLTAQRGPYLTMSVHDPIGVIGAITPWNSPIASEAQKIAPALAAGNAVILKPAEWTPLVALTLARIIEEAGLPAGLLSVLPGRGSVIGDAIVKHPGVGKVSFTGGTTTGRLIGHAAAEKIMPVTLELGGKSPTIVFSDAEIGHAINGVMFGIFSSTGQSCIAGSRLFVQREIYKEFTDELVRRTLLLRVGPGTDPRTHVAPMVAHAHRDIVSGFVDRARAEGARLRCGGNAPTGREYADGAYYLPTILDGLTNESRTCQEEIFGPVLVTLPFDDEADLICQANGTVFGLACGIWTQDIRRAWRVARAVDAGTVWINTYKAFSSSTPFSGVKESGIGQEKGREGIRSYMRQKGIYIGLNDDPLPWADAIRRPNGDLATQLDDWAQLA